MKKILLLVFLMTCVVPDGVALSFKVDGMDYRLIDGNSECVALVNAKSGTNVTVPDEVAYDGVTYKVTEISDYSFYVKTIEGTLNIGKNVSFIDETAFFMARVENVNVSNDNVYFTSLDGVLFSKDLKRLVLFPNTRGDIVVSVPLGTTEIASNAFSECDSIQQVMLPEGLREIGDRNFYCCERLTDIKIPTTVEDIGHSCFVNTPWYEAQPNGALYCGNHVLWEIKGTPPVNNGIFTVNEDCLFIASNVYFRHKINTIHIPREVRRVRNSGFNLMNFDVDKDNSYYKSVEGVLLTKDGSRLERFPCERKGRYVVPQGVKIIGREAFSDAYNLTRVTLPEGVECIEDYAFHFCEGLERVELPASLFFIGKRAFEPGIVLHTTPRKAYSEDWGSHIPIVFCRATNPPVANRTIFWGFDIYDSNLFVPKGTSKAYHAASPWNELGEIIEIDFADVNGDGNVNGSDVTALYNELLGGVEAAGVSDVNGDGYVNGADVTALYTRLLN